MRLHRRYTKHATPLKEVPGRLPAGRTMTFLTFVLPERNRLPMDAQISRGGRAVCSKAFESSPVEHSEPSRN